MQAFIDRRFFRRKYDAAQILERFAATARDEVDLERLTVAVQRTVLQALEPATISAWLAVPAGGLARPVSRSEKPDDYL